MSQIQKVKAQEGHFCPGLECDNQTLLSESQLHSQDEKDTGKATSMGPGHAPQTPVKWKKVKMTVAQSCPTLCNTMDYTVHGILQARILEWVAVPFSRGSSQPRDWTQVSHIAGEFLTSWATREAQTPAKWPRNSDNTTVQLTDVNGSAGEASSSWKAAVLSELHSNQLDTERRVTWASHLAPAAARASSEDNDFRDQHFEYISKISIC